jgi:hypothetical protein
MSTYIGAAWAQHKLRSLAWTAGRCWMRSRKSDGKRPQTSDGMRLHRSTSCRCSARSTSLRWTPCAGDGPAPEEVRAPRVRRVTGAASRPASRLAAGLDAQRRPRWPLVEAQYGFARLDMVGDVDGLGPATFIAVRDCTALCRGVRVGSPAAHHHCLSGVPHRPVRPSADDIFLVRRPCRHHHGVPAVPTML